MKKWFLCLLLCVAVLATSIGGAIMDVCANVDVSETQPLQSAGLVDFVVEVEAGRDIRVLQLTDPQIIAGEYQRYAERGTGQWSHAEKDKHEKYVEQIITRYNPDFIIVTGDVIYGEFDDSGASLLRYIKFMDSFQIPWAPVAGNHDWESSMGADWMCQQYEKSEYCLFKQRTLSGNGNYTVGLQQDGKLKRVFFMLDSNGCVNASKASLANGHTPTSFGFQQDQISWYTEVANTIKAQSPDTKISFAFHIQINAFALAMAKYGTVGNVIDIDAHPDKEATDFGYMGRGLKSNWDTDNTVFNGLKALGVDSIFVGHEHCNSTSVVYEGVRLQYGQKSSTYDRANYKQANGTIVGSYSDAGEEIIGGTVIPVSELDGSIVNPYILYYDPDYGNNASNSQVFDFNGQDFDMTVTTPNVKDRGNATTLSNTTEVPAGFTDSVALTSDGYLNAVGVKFPADINFNNINSIKMRVYIAPYTVASGKTPLIRLYDGETNSILAELKVDSTNFGKWIDIELFSLFESAKNAPTIVNDGVLQPFTLGFRTYSATQASSPIYFDSLTITYVEELYNNRMSMSFDCNGIDFDMSVTTPDVKDAGVATTLTDTGAVPTGFTGGVASGSNGYLNAIGVKFPADINYDHIESVKLRIYISPYTVTSGKTPLMRLYDGESNTILGEIKVDSANFGEWVDIELYSLLESAQNAPTIVKNSVLQPFTLVYRTYSATQASSPIYFDSLIIEYTDDIYSFPDISEGEEENKRPTHTEGNYDGQQYARLTLSSFGYDKIDFANENKVVIKTGEEAMSLNFIYYPMASGDVNLKFATDKDGNGGYNVKLNSTGFSIYSATNATFNYNFTEGEAYNIEVGFVKMEANPVTGEYNGNQAYMFLKVNGDIGSTDAKGKYYHIVDIYTYKNNEYLTISTTATTTDKPVLETVVVEPIKNGWIAENGKWAYYEQGVMLKNCWKKDSIGWCYLGKEGYMLTNAWVRDSIGWCYVAADGYCVTNCWKKDSIGWIYLDANGSMTKSAWVLDGGKWYYLDANGYMVSNKWMKDSKGWVYLGANGAMVTNKWVRDSVGWCYVGADGYAVTNCWKKDTKGWCYLNSEGRMATNCWVRDSKGWCYVGADGYCVTNKWVKDSKGWCYLNANGNMAVNNWVQSGGKWYFMDANGYMISNTSKYWNGKKYYFNTSGVCTNP